eukprot:Nk52_evm18s1810 gene=Nk52_evmTU18s1810
MGSKQSKRKEEETELRRRSSRSRRDTFVYTPSGSVQRRSTYDESLSFKVRELTYLDKIRRHLLHRTELLEFLAGISGVVIVQIVITCLCVFLCDYFDIFIDIHPSFFIATVIFPMAFILNASYLRRERALEDIALFKSSAIEVYFMFREWNSDAEVDSDFSYYALYEIRELFRRIKVYLAENRKPEREPVLQGIYTGFSKLSKLVNIIRRNPGSIQGMWALNTRMIHYHHQMCLAFEKLRVIREYQTPRSLRAFTKILIYLLPVIASPYFVYVGRERSSGRWTAYYMATLLCFILGCLQHVQDDLDDPFDGFGQDDIDLNMFSDWVAVALYKNIPKPEEEYNPVRDLDLKSQLFSQVSFANLTNLHPENVASQLEQAAKMRTSIISAQNSISEDFEDVVDPSRRTSRSSSRLSSKHSSRRPSEAIPPDTEVSDGDSPDTVSPDTPGKSVSFKRQSILSGESQNPSDSNV